MTNHQPRVKIVHTWKSCDPQFAKSNKEKCGTLDLESLQNKGFEEIGSGLKEILQATQAFIPGFSVSCSPSVGGMGPWALNETSALPREHLAHAVNRAGDD